MPEPDAHPVRCEFDSLAEPVRGRILDGRGGAVPFEGWLGFAVSITEAAMRTRPPTDASPKDDPA